MVTFWGGRLVGHAEDVPMDRQSYWNSRMVRWCLLDQLRDRNVVLRYSSGVRRNFGQMECLSGCARGPIRVELAEGATDNPYDLAYWVTPELEEVHAEVGLPDAPGDTDRLVVDLDTYGEVPWGSVCEAALGVFEILDRTISVRDLHIRYTGNRGLHVVGTLPAPRRLVELRERVKGELLWGYPRWNLDWKSLIRFTAPKKNEQWTGITVDLSGMTPRHPIRCIGSLHRKTGRVCVRVGTTADELMGFRVEEAEVRNVLEHPERYLKT